MPSIHVNPEELRNLSRTLDQQARMMLDDDTCLRQAGSQLDMAWQGGSSADFMQELQSVQNGLRMRIEELYVLSQRLSREADRWEESDLTWVQEIRKVFGFLFKGRG